MLWRLWQRMTAPTTVGEEARRHESVLLTLLALSLVGFVVALVAQVASLALGSPQSPAWAAVCLLVGAAFAGLLLLARTGYRRTASTALLVVYAIPALAVMLVAGEIAPMPYLLIALDMLLAAIFFGPRGSLWVGAIGATTIFVLGLLQTRGHIPLDDSPLRPGMTDATGYALVIALIALVCRLYTREAEASIDEVLTHGSADSPLRQLRTKTLSVREVEVVQLVAEGLTNDAIAKHLFVSPRTIHTHVANAMRKTETSNRTELGVLAIREGLAPLDAGAPNAQAVTAR